MGKAARFGITWDMRGKKWYGECNQHFIVAETYDEETLELQIVDPWDGKRKRLPAAYSPVLGGWDLERAIYGLRCLRAA